MQNESLFDLSHLKRARKGDEESIDIIISTSEHIDFILNSPKDNKIDVLEDLLNLSTYQNDLSEDISLREKLKQALKKKQVPETLYYNVNQSIKDLWPVTYKQTASKEIENTKEEIEKIEELIQKILKEIKDNSNDSELTL